MKSKETVEWTGRLVEGQRSPAGGITKTILLLSIGVFTSAHFICTLIASAKCLYSYFGYFKMFGNQSKVVHS